MQNNLIQRTIPNVLTVFRCLTAVFLPLIIIYGGEIGAIMAIPLLFLAGISDYFDGFFARKYNVVSNFGKIIDPVADKLLVIGIILALASENMLDYYYAFVAGLIIILREVLISGLRESMSSHKFTLSVTLLSKWKTTIQLVACGSFLVWRANSFFYELNILGLVSYSLLWLAAIMTLITGMQYISNIISFFEKQKNKDIK